MTRLRAPLADYLSQDVPEATLHDVWLRIRKRRMRRSTPGPYRLAWGALAAALVVLFFSWSELSSESGPLVSQDGRPLQVLEGGTGRRLALSDGSAIELAEASSLEVLGNDTASFVTVLRRGRGTFDVKPGGSRRWRVEAGGVQVEVVGTRFTVERFEDQVFVHVERGAVLVRGDQVPDRVQRLSAGAGLVVKGDRSVATGVPPRNQPSGEPPDLGDDAPEARGGDDPEASLLDEEAAAASAPAAMPPSGRDPTRPSVGAEEARPPPPGAPGEPRSQATDPVASANAKGPSPKRRPADEVGTLLAQADRQRLDGKTDTAIATLQELLARSSSDPRRSLAAFTLAKLLIDQGRLSEAESALRACLAGNPGHALAEHAWARLVDVQLRSGQASAARQSAREFARRYPNSQRLGDLERQAEDLRF